jgi:uncharacterized protein YbjQ (UPF0145 family)
MYPISIPGAKPANHIDTIVPSGATKMRLIHEALSRVRMRRPQAVQPSSEAYRPAREIAMQARRQAARELGIH